MFLKTIGVSVELVLVVEVCFEAEADLFADVVVDGDAVEPCFNLKTIILDVILSAGEVKLSQSGRALQNDDKCLRALD